MDRRITRDVVRNILKDPPPPLLGDINFEELPSGFEIWYSERIANDYRDLVDQSADYLEDQLGVLKIDHEILMADGVLTEEVKDGLIAWWAARVEDLQLG